PPPTHHLTHSPTRRSSDLDQATQLGDRVQANSPLVTALSQRVDTKLAPILEQAQTTAATIHDAVLKVNSALLAINRFPGVTVPTDRKSTRLNSSHGSISYA